MVAAPQFFPEAPMNERADASRPDSGSSPIILPPGTELPLDCTIEGILAEPGAHAIVYRARQGETPVAIKELFPRALLARTRDDPSAHPTDPQAASRMNDARRRFLLEAQLLESLEHTSLPTVRAHFEANGTAYLVMDLIAGRGLDAHLASVGRMPLSQASAIVLAILDALEALHGHGILHRDVAPENIILGHDGRARLLGLGTPRQLLMYGVTGAVAPRSGFASIEMYGTRGKGPWTDVHGAAALLYALLTGTPPASAVDRAAGESLVHPSRLVSDVPWAIDMLIVKSLAQRPEERPHSAERFRAMLEEALAETRVGTRTPAFAPTPPQPSLAVPARSTPPRSFAKPPGPMTPTGGLARPMTTLPEPRAAVALTGVQPTALTDAEMRDDEGDDANVIAFDTTGAQLILPQTPSVAANYSKWGIGAAVAAVLLFAAVKLLLRDRPVDVLPSPASAAVEQRPRAGLPVSTDSTTNTTGTRTVTAPAPLTAPAQSPPPRISAPDRAAVEPAQRVADIVIPTVRAPVINTPVPTGTMTAVAPEVVEDLQEGLTSVRSRIEAGDYAGAQRVARSTTSRIDDVAARHVPSAALTSLRREIAQEAVRAREACEAVNTIARRRNGQVVACE